MVFLSHIHFLDTGLYQLFKSENPIGEGVGEYEYSPFLLDIIQVLETLLDHFLFFFYHYSYLTFHISGSHFAHLFVIIALGNLHSDPP